MSATLVDGRYLAALLDRETLNERVAELELAYDELFKAKVLPTFQALKDLEELVRQLRPTRSGGFGYGEALDDVLELIADLARAAG